MRKRAAQALNPEMGRMGAKDTMGIPGRASTGMGLSLGLTRRANDRQHLPHGALEVVVDHDMVEVGCDGHLGFRNALPRRTILGVLAVPLRPAPQELVHGGWRQEDPQRIRRSLAHLFGALDVDLEDDVVAGCALLVELRERSAVQVAAVGRVFEEGTLADQPLERLPRYEVVVDAIDLARPGPAGGVGDRVSKVGIDLEQALDDRVLADARRTRDDDQETSTRMALVLHAPLPHPLPCGERGSTDAQNDWKSAGGATSNVISALVPGWRRRRRHACSIGRSGSPGPRPPYSASPATG